jgi:hypothetical protein
MPPLEQEAGQAGQRSVIERPEIYWRSHLLKNDWPYHMNDQKTSKNSLPSGGILNLLAVGIFEDHRLRTKQR